MRTTGDGDTGHTPDTPAPDIRADLPIQQHFLNIISLVAHPTPTLALGHSSPETGWRLGLHLFCEAQARVRRGSGKDRQGMALKAKGLKA